MADLQQLINKLIPADRIPVCPLCGEPIQEGADVVLVTPHKSMVLVHRSCVEKISLDNSKEILNAIFQVEFSDGCRFSIPVSVIAQHHAEFYANEHGTEIDQELNTNTIPYFYQEPFNIEDWALNHMSWVDVKDVAKAISTDMRLTYDNYIEEWPEVMAGVVNRE